MENPNDPMMREIKSVIKLFFYWKSPDQKVLHMSYAKYSIPKYMNCFRQ